jgi:hypothetical protein
LGEFITTFGGIYNCNLDHFKMTIRRDVWGWHWAGTRRSSAWTNLLLRRVEACGEFFLSFSVNSLPHCHSRVSTSSGREKQANIQKKKRGGKRRDTCTENLTTLIHSCLRPKQSISGGLLGTQTNKFPFYLLFLLYWSLNTGPLFLTQALYHLIHTLSPSPFCFTCFSNMVSHFLPGPMRL